MNEKNNTLPLILAFLAGVVIAAMVAFAVVKQQGPPAAATPAATEAQPQSAEAADSAVKALNYTEAFPSWNPDSASLHALVDFVSACADLSGPDYLEPADRIATFDMDGTILCEKAPVYIDYCLTMYRVLDDPSFSATEEERDAMQADTRPRIFRRGDVPARGPYEEGSCRVGLCRHAPRGVSRLRGRFRRSCQRGGL